jgi:hypothetical protein
MKEILIKVTAKQSSQNCVVLTGLYKAILMSEKIPALNT